MSKIIKKLIFILSAVVVLLVGIVIWYQASINYKVKADTKITINEGESVGAIGVDLLENKLIKSKLAFKIYLKLSGGANLQAGEYNIKAGSNLREIVRRLAKGEALFAEKNILIKEGMNLKEINQYLKDNNLIQGNCDKLFSTMIKDLPPEFDRFEFLQTAPQKTDLEGYLFPDTYRVFADADCQDLVIKMLDNFQAKVSVEFGEIKAQKKTLFEILTMASVLEKEVRSEADMKIVSGVFWNRIKNGQRLESCATLAYILGENKPQYTLADTQIDSPYNTYRNDGLPPTPINNPGLKSIRAAIYPEKSDYNYFLSRPDTGETVFSRTFEEHKMNKAKYLK
jgi:UPF0755 protein